jgi:hypothetical protein
MIRRLLVAAVFALAMIAPAAVTTAAPAPITVQGTNYITETYYYSDATYTVEVGYESNGCGTYAQIGIQTEYYRRYREPCL